MSQKEAPRVGLLKALGAGRVTGREVAAAVRRCFEAAGAEGLLHRGRGRSSPRRLVPRLRQQVARLLTTTYRDFNDCHATEKLQEVEGLAISRATVRRLRQALGRPASTAAGPGGIARAASPAPAWGRSCRSTPARSTGSKGAGRP